MEIKHPAAVTDSAGCYRGLIAEEILELEKDFFGRFSSVFLTKAFSKNLDSTPL